MLKKIVLKPGVNRENTRYANEGGWYDCDKIRFRQGTPEKIGGWQKISDSTYLGICRSLWPWSTLASLTYTGLGTHLKYYVETGGSYFDITPIRASTTINTDPFSTTSGLTLVTVTDTAHGAVNGDFVTFSGASAVAGLTLNGEYQITYVSSSSYTITAATTANATTTGGGAAVTAAYQLSVGAAIQTPVIGWGSGTWGSGTWGIGTPGTALAPLRIWTAQNFGEDLVYGIYGGALYYWDASVGTGTRGVPVTGMGSASDVPVVHNHLLVSDTSRFVMVFGTNQLGGSTVDPMLIRWSDQESAVNWTPAITNQAGDLRLSHGSEIMAVLQVRQEILVWSDTSMYSMQYLGPPAVWGATLLGDNTSIASSRAAATAAGATFWMGNDKFYVYDGRPTTLPCDLRAYVFGDINRTQMQQIFATTVEGFSEIWWFYCSENSTTVDRYVVFNYLEKAWYYGTMARTAAIDTSCCSDYPVAAANQKLVYHENGVDDNETATPTAINAYITSSQFDIEDGHNFGFVWRMLPDVSFVGSTASYPSVTMTLLPLAGSGAGYTSPASVAGSESATATRSATVPVEAYTNQVNIRVRARQMSIKIASDTTGVQWQLGHPRIDIRPDGRKA